MDNLSREAKIAKELGMSYGQFKGMQLERGVRFTQLMDTNEEVAYAPPKTESVVRTAKCAICGAVFVPHGERSMMCSDACRKKRRQAQAELMRRKKGQKQRKHQNGGGNNATKKV